MRMRAHEFLEMGRAGVFAPEARLERIEGEIIGVAPGGSSHAAVLSELTSPFVRAAAGRVIVPSQSPLDLGEGTVPQPDLALLEPTPDRYFGQHPRASDALLVVEVSNTTLRFDLDSKAPLYARAGAPEAWVIDIERRAIRVFRESDAGGYRTSFTATGSEPIQPLALADISISAGALFPWYKGSRPAAASSICAANASTATSGQNQLGEPTFFEFKEACPRTSAEGDVCLSTRTAADCRLQRNRSPLLHSDFPIS